jgi:hypothetical protein
MWLFARYLSLVDDLVVVGTEELVFAQDVVEIRSL